MQLTPQNWMSKQAVDLPKTLSTQPAQVNLPQMKPVKDSIQLRFASNAQAVGDKKDFMSEVQKRGVLVLGGAGIMGSGIAVNHMMSGIPAYIYDVNEAAVQGGVAKLQKEITGAATPRKPGQEPLISQQEATEAMARLKGTMATLDNAKPENGVMPNVVIEAVFEDMALKKRLFGQLSNQLPDDTIFATNTSSLSVAEMAKSVKNPENFVGLHFFKPANRNRFIEIIPGPQTSQKTIDKMFQLSRAMGKTPILCQDAPGFVVNRLLIPVMNEGVRMLDQGVSNTKTIEQAFMETVWPNAHKDPKIAKGLLGPFGGQNQDNYIWIIGKTTQVLHDGLKDKYGNSYQPTKTVNDKFKAYEDALARSKANGTPLDQELASVRYKLEGDIEGSKKQAIQDRFLGMIFGIATQLVDEKVTSPEDVDRGVQAALKWEIGPFELMNKLGPKKALALVEAYAKTNPGFKVADTLKAQAKSGKAFPLSLVDSRKEGSAQIITFNRPQAHGLNYLSPAMLNNLRDAFRKAEKDPTVKTIVFESVGGKAFISGADIFALGADLMNLEADLKKSTLVKVMPKGLQRQYIDTRKYLKVRKFVKHGADVFAEISRAKKVTVAKISGLALGGGTELPLACDYIFASDRAKTMGLPETKYGIFPAWGGTELLTRRVGTDLARFLVLEGGQMGKGGKGPAILNATQAKEIGLVDDVIPALEIDRVVAEKVASGELKKRNWKVPSKSEVLAKVGSNGNWAQKANRYETAKLEDLVQNELKGLYLPALKLADARLVRTAKGIKNGRIQQERDMLAMAQNMAGAERAAKKAAAAAAQDKPKA